MKVLSVMLCACSVSAVKFTDFDQGAPFTKCIKQTDLETKTLNDEVETADRDSSGCCPAGGWIPGIKNFNAYFGAMVVCGFQSDGKVAWAKSGTTCTYNTCYVVKNPYTCKDGSMMRLNGCCPEGQYPDDCKRYKKTINIGVTGSAVNGVNYCTTYAKSYQMEGTSTKADDQANGKLDLGTLYQYTACGATKGAGFGSGGGGGGGGGSNTAVAATGSVKISDLEQGAAFNKCVKKTQLETKTLTDTIDTVARDSSGCCPPGSWIPGILNFNAYFGAMIVCGFKSDGSVGWTKVGSTCNYNQCYVVKNSYTCKDSSKMRLNGCCPEGQYPTDCKRYKKTINIGVTGSAVSGVNYCTTYAATYQMEGTSSKTDDQANGKLDLSKLYQYTACGATKGGGFSGGGSSGGSGTNNASLAPKQVGAVSIAMAIVMAVLSA